MDAGVLLVRSLVAYPPNPFCSPMRLKGCVAVIHAHLMGTVEEASESASSGLHRMTWPALGAVCRLIDSIDTEAVWEGPRKNSSWAPPTASADSQPLMNQPRCGRMWVGDGQTSDRDHLGHGRLVIG